MSELIFLGYYTSITTQNTFTCDLCGEKSGYGLHTFAPGWHRNKSFHWIHVYVNDAINIVKLCMALSCCVECAGKAKATILSI